MVRENAGAQIFQSVRVSIEPSRVCKLAPRPPVAFWAKRRTILVASRSIFPLVLTNEEQYANLQLWK